MLDEECLSSGPVGLTTFARGLLPCDPGLAGLARGLMRVATGETLVPVGPTEEVPSKFSTDSMCGSRQLASKVMVLGPFA